MIYWKIWLPATDHMMNLMENLLPYLNKHTPKKEWFHGNPKPHINKTLRHEIMKRSRLKNKASKTNIPSDIKNNKKQRNYNVQLNKKAKLEYFNNFDSSQGSKSF